MLEGGQAGDTRRLLSPVPTHQEPLATPIMAVGLPTWQSSLRAPWSPRPVRSGALGGGAGRGRARGPGEALGTRREAGLLGGPWAAPSRPLPNPPAHQELQTRRRELAAAPVLSACWAHGSYL